MGLSDVDNVSREGVCIREEVGQFSEEGSIGGNEYIAQISEGGIVWCKLGGMVQERGVEED